MKLYKKNIIFISLLCFIILFVSGSRINIFFGNQHLTNHSDRGGKSFHLIGDNFTPVYKDDEGNIYCGHGSDKIENIEFPDSFEPVDKYKMYWKDKENLYKYDFSCGMGLGQGCICWITNFNLDKKTFDSLDFSSESKEFGEPSQYTQYIDYLFSQRNEIKK